LSPRVDNASAGGDFAAMCDDAGHIADVLRNDLDLPIAISDKLGCIVDEHDLTKFDLFLAAGLVQDAVIDWPINVATKGRIETRRFSAVRIDGQMLVVVAAGRLALARLSEIFVPMAHIAHVRLSRRLAELVMEFHNGSGDDRSVLEDFSRVNNDLATAERRLLKSNRRLARANEQLRVIYESLPIGVFRTDPQGIVEEGNAQFRALAGTVSTQDWLEQVHDDDKERVRASWNAAIASGHEFGSRHRQMTATCEWRDVAAMAVPLRDGESRVAGFLGVVQDVSEAVRTEEQAREIERQSIVRQLTGGLAHNLNNLMAVVMMTAEQILEDLPDDHPARAGAKRNFAAAGRAAVLTRRLMVYSGLRPMALTEFDVDDAVTSIVDSLQDRLADSYPIVLQLDAAGAFIRHNEELLREALDELISNARLAMPDGGQIVVSTTRHARGADGPALVSIAIADIGSGMEDDISRRAAEPFFTTRNAGQGVGLGLSLVDGFARMAGGSMQIRSGADKGTIVELLLPISDRSAGTEQQPRDAGSPTGLAPV
jgi:PAS domain S-box-containing protein